MYTLSQPATVNKLIDQIKTQSISVEDMVENLSMLGNKRDREHLWTAASQYGSDDWNLKLLQCRLIEINEARSFFRTHPLLLAQALVSRNTPRSTASEVLWDIVCLPATSESLQATELLCSVPNIGQGDASSTIIWRSARNHHGYLGVLSKQPWFDKEDAIHAVLSFQKERVSRALPSSTVDFLQAIHVHQPLEFHECRQMIKKLQENRAFASWSDDLVADMRRLIAWLWERANLSAEQQQKIANEYIKHHQAVMVDAVLPLMDPSIQDIYVSLLASSNTPNALILQERQELHRIAQSNEEGKTVTPSASLHRKI